MRRLEKKKLSYSGWQQLLEVEFQPKGSPKKLEEALHELESYSGDFNNPGVRAGPRLAIKRLAKQCLGWVREEESKIPPAHTREHLRRLEGLLRQAVLLLDENWVVGLAVQSGYSGSGVEFWDTLRHFAKLSEAVRTAAATDGTLQFTWQGQRVSSPAEFYTLLGCYNLLSVFGRNPNLGLTKQTGPLVRFADAVYQYATGEETKLASFNRSLDQLRRVLPGVKKILAAARRDSLDRQAKSEPKNRRPPRRRRMGLSPSRVGRLQRSARPRRK